MCYCSIANVVTESRYHALVTLTCYIQPKSYPIFRTTQATQRARSRWEEGQKIAMEKAAAQAVDDKEKALEDARRVRQSYLHPAVVNASCTPP